MQRSYTLHECISLYTAVLRTSVVHSNVEGYGQYLRHRHVSRRL